MWIALSDAFLSVVADQHNPDRLMVRARRKQHLVNVFGGEYEIIETPDRDYRWRVVVERAAFSEIVQRRIEKLDYGNFKSSVHEHDLHNLYLDFWVLHRDYQVRDETVGGSEISR